MGNGIKTFFKVLYIAVSLVVAVFVAIITYNNYAISHIQNLATTAVNAKNYNEVERIFGTFFSTKAEIYEVEKDYEFVIYPSVAFSSYTYTNASGEKTLYEQEDKAYYLYLIKPSIDIINDVKSSTISNQSGFRLYFNDGTSFLYNFAVDSTYNSNLLKEEPQNLNDAILYSKRNTFTAYSYLNYFDITITTSIVNAAKEVSNSSADATVSAIAVVDSTGKDVKKYDANLDFNQTFYSYAQTYVDKYNTYIKDFKAAVSNDTKKSLTSEFENFFYGSNKDGYYYTFSNNPDCGVGYGKDYAYPWWLYLQAGGMTLLFAVVLFLLYMLLFHFSFLRSLAQRLTTGRNRPRNQGRRGNVNVEASRIKKVNDENNLKADVKEVETKDNKEDEKNEETK